MPFKPTQALLSKVLIIAYNFRAIREAAVLPRYGQGQDIEEGGAEI